MNDTKFESQAIFRHEFVVPHSAIDRNGHVNNVFYIQWMQDVAIRHSDATGGTAAMQSVGCTWVVRSHQIEYMSPAFAGNEIAIITWVVNLRRVRSLRRYKFVWLSDGRLLARGETDWVFINSSGRPRAIPESIRTSFPLMPDYE
ncbi:thioesterase family protein [Myxosarcina sp. GI1]|uniref:acyl-CoA thioesterase n=1 Tax=Myxosarcina sp. GI1 TaxID=1541065 RepID=UPI00055F3F64|nr:acyl-CoA thioesterase [Myxosarcina sp. GI1]